MRLVVADWPTLAVVLGTERLPRDVDRLGARPFSDLLDFDSVFALETSWRVSACTLTLTRLTLKQSIEDEDAARQ